MLYGIEFLTDTGKAKDADGVSKSVMKISLRGRLNISTAGEMSTLLEAVVRGGIRRIMMDASDMDYIDSTGIAVLVKIAKQIRADKGQIAMLNVPPELLKVMKMVHLDTYIQQFYSDKKALDYLYGP